MRNKFTLLFIVLIFSALSNKLMAQCTPVVFPGSAIFYPDTNSTLLPAAATNNYESVIQINIPQTLMVDIGIGFPIAVSPDSIILTNVSGMPSGFSYSTNNGTGVWLKNTRGCISINGTPAQSQIGNYTINLNLTCYIAGSADPYELVAGNYKLQVKDSNNVGISQNFNLKNGIQNIYPNPVSKSATIEYISSSSKTAHIELVNIIGSQIIDFDKSMNTGMNLIQIERNNIPSGIYFIRINDGINKYIQKIVLE